MNDNILNQVKEFFTTTLGIDEKLIQPEISIFQLGIDSVMMITVVKEINDLFGVDLSLSDITFKYNTIDLMCKYIAESQNSFVVNTTQKEYSETTIDEDVVIENVESSLFENDNIITNSDLNQDVIYQICLQQKEAMQNVFMKQLDVIKHIYNNDCGKLSKVNNELQNKENVSKSKAIINSNNKSTNKSTNNITPKPQKATLTKQQSLMLQKLIESLTQKNKKSKKLAADYRPYLADLDEVAGFKLLLKEIHYQISVESSQGCEMIDVDGNHYVDIAMGFGSLILGYSPKIVMDAMRNELDRGMQLAPRHRLVGEVAKLVCDLTGFERACFTVTGTEAVMTAMKFARAYKRKGKIGIFTGCYHGHNDATLVTRIKKDGEGHPIAAGISEATLKDMVLFDYNDMSSIQKIRDMKDELAAVLIEPVQSRRPEIQPVKFLRELRKVTEENNILLIFDEVITGFRCNTGGAKRLFGIEPDLATYGKAACNGMPIGIVAGKAEIMDVADGGQWEYGDNSYPMKEQTFYAGTFFKHPLTMAAAHTILSYYKENNNALQEELTAKTTNLVKELNAIFRKYNAPIEVNNFSSLFKFKELNDDAYIDIFYYKLLDYGVFTWEGRTCFLSEAHTDQDIRKIIDAVENSVRDMANSGFYFQDENNFTEGVPDQVFYD